MKRTANPSFLITSWIARIHSTGSAADETRLLAAE
jgi:hypothetical protein